MKINEVRLRLLQLFHEPKQIPELLVPNYFHSLNGFRGIAILMVVISHLHLSSGILYETIFNGKLGVLIFFVLSGFLITTIILKEKILTKNFSLHNFYIRRTLRIFPVAYLFLLVLIFFNTIYSLEINYISIAGAALYLINISSIFRVSYNSWFTGHFWSLSVEEQFYLIFPILMKFKFSHFVVVNLFITLILPILLFFQEYYKIGTFTLLTFSTHYLIKFQPISIGCLTAVICFKQPICFSIPMRRNVLVNVCLCLLILFIQYDNYFNFINIFWGLIISICVAIVIVINIKPSTSFIFQFLNSRFMNAIGIGSYSIYIWQQLFTSNESKLPRFMIDKPYNIIGIIIISFLSYTFYEQFFMQLKSKFTLKRRIVDSKKNIRTLDA